MTDAILEHVTEPKPDDALRAAISKIVVRLNKAWLLARWGNGTEETPFYEPTAEAESVLMKHVAPLLAAERERTAELQEEITWCRESFRDTSKTLMENIHALTAERDAAVKRSEEAERGSPHGYNCLRRLEEVGMGKGVYGNSLVGMVQEVCQKFVDWRDSSATNHNDCVAAEADLTEARRQLAECRAEVVGLTLAATDNHARAEAAEAACAAMRPILDGCRAILRHKAIRPSMDPGTQERMEREATEALRPTAGQSLLDELRQAKEENARLRAALEKLVGDADCQGHLYAGEINAIAQAALRPETVTPPTE